MDLCSAYGSPFPIKCVYLILKMYDIKYCEHRSTQIITRKQYSRECQRNDNCREIVHPLKYQGVGRLEREVGSIYSVPTN
jgi:hypothetical protein